jgi:glycerophosphoryl diester phosphodiesterase
MSNPFRRPKGQPLIYGHRGARAVLPENTMVGFEYLAEIGVPAVEIDVQNVQGGVPVVIHDPLVPMQLARDGAGNWLPAPGPKIRDLTVAELQAYDLGRLHPDHDYGKRYPNQRPVDGARAPLLADVLGWQEKHDGMILNIEIKSFAHRDDLGDPPAALVASVLAALAAHDLAARVVISSFDWRVLSALKAAAPEIARAYLSYQQPGEDLTVTEGSPWMAGLSLAQAGGSLPRLIAAQGARAWCPYFRDLTPQAVAEAHDADLAVNVWTVNAEEDMRAMMEMGVDGIITDDPALALKVIG